MNFFLIFLVGVGTAFIGSLVGGGSLISIPMLVLFGLPPQVAIGTNRLGTLGLCFGAIPKYWKEQKIRWRIALISSVITLPGIYIGTRILINIDQVSLSRVIGILILLVLPFVIMQKHGKGVSEPEKKSHSLIGYLLYILIGVYDGFFGAGVGIFMRSNLMLLFKLNFVEAIATDFIPGFISTIFSLIIFINVGFVYFTEGFFLLAGMFIGGYLGAHVAVKQSDNRLKGAFIVFALVMAIKLIFF